MIITEIRFRKHREIDFIIHILCKQSGKAERVDKIRFNYSNSFPEKPPIRFQEKRFLEKRLIRFHELLARVYSTETRK